MVAHFLSSLSWLPFLSPLPLRTSQALFPLWNNSKVEETHQSEKSSDNVQWVKIESYLRTELDTLPVPLSSLVNLESA